MDWCSLLCKERDMTQLEIYLRELVEKRVIDADQYDDIMYLHHQAVKQSKNG